MSGAVKHMERSHRSYGNKQAVFGRFEAKAYRVRTVKESRKAMKGNFVKNMADKFKSVFKKDKGGDK